MITIDNLTKRFGTTAAVKDLSFCAPDGAVTGFIGPNGAGKSTTLRLLLGLDRPTSGRALVNGVPYQALVAPARRVGAVLDSGSIQKGRSAVDHLRWVAKAAGVSPLRVRKVLDDVGLAGVADRRIREFSLGMRQRLAIAVALLGRPSILVLDEPLNGLDPDGVIWVRALLREHAARGGTVLVSSHLLRELEETADRVVLIARGRLVADVSMAEVTTRSSGAIRVVADDGPRLARALEQAGARVLAQPDGTLDVEGLDSRTIGCLALENRIPLVELVPQHSGLEQAFLELTKEQAA